MVQHSNCHSSPKSQFQIHQLPYLKKIKEKVDTPSLKSPPWFYHRKKSSLFYLTKQILESSKTLCFPSLLSHPRENGSLSYSKNPRYSFLFSPPYFPCNFDGYQVLVLKFQRVHLNQWKSNNGFLCLNLVCGISSSCLVRVDDLWISKLIMYTVLWWVDWTDWKNTTVGNEMGYCGLQYANILM